MGGMHLRATSSRRGYLFQIFPGRIVEPGDYSTGFESINSIQEIKTEKAYIGDHGCWANCRGYIIAGGHVGNSFAEYKFTVKIREGLEGSRHKFGNVKPLATDVN